MVPLYALVAHGDDASRRLLTRRLDGLPGVDVIDTCRSTLDVARAVRARSVHLLVLDARLPPDDGEAALRRLRDAVPPAVVVSCAGPGDGLWAYALGAVDCLPVAAGEDRLARAVERARERVVAAQLRARRDQLLGDAGAPTRGSRPLVVRTGGRLVFVDPAEIDWIEASGVYVCVHAGAASYLVRETLRRVEEELDPARFVRVHRSTILNVGRIRTLVPHASGGALVVLKDGTKLKMSRSYRERIRASIG